MPIFKKKNENFFKKWSPEMAYVLGFFSADGSMFVNPRGSRYAAFYSTDKSILKKIRKALNSSHHLGIRKFRPGMNKKAYVLQIGSKTIFHDLQKLGLNPNKSKNLRLPAVPKKYMPDFIRGYFDGDGSVTISAYQRKNRGNRKARTILSGFTSGSKRILVDLQKYLQKYAHLAGGTLYFANRGYRLYFSVNDSRKLYMLMYQNMTNQLFLLRKKRIFESY